jgi:glucose-6-phosphate 1-dehydrogenase
VFVIFGITGGLAKVMTFQLEHPAPVHPYAKGSWWPDAAEHALAGNGRWHDLWVAS